LAELVFIVSDLHLGGAPGEGDRPGFQMCTRTARLRLAAFIHWVADQASNARVVRLVVAGDIVDFLAEEDARAAHGFSAFTADEHAAQHKLERIFKRTAEVWDALAYAATRVRLTLMMGNHDVELALPGPRRALLARLNGAAVELLLDGEALSLGPVLIDHGNRSDPWNQIDHDTLRELRSELSRREPTARTLQTPGSELVVQVMNGLKTKYEFVDLLKPETGAVLPLLAVLEPLKFSTLDACATLAASKLRNRIDNDGKPRDGRKIGTVDEVGVVALAHNAAVPSACSGDDDLDLARELAHGSGAREVGSESRGKQIGAIDTLLGFCETWRASQAPDRERLVLRLLKALRRLNRSDETFNVNHEREPYFGAARAAAKRRYKLVVYGHTHIVKRVDLGGGATYLNTGTWADLIRLPTNLETEDSVAVGTLDSFASD